MLLFPLDFHLDPGTRLAPIFKGKFHLFFSSLISNLLILAEEPKFLNILLLHILSRVVMIVVRATLETILILEDNRLIVIGKETLKWETVSRTLLLFEF